MNTGNKQLIATSDEWVREICSFLDTLGLTYAIGCKNRIHLLNLPVELESKLLEKTNEYGLIIHVHEQENAIYRGFFEGKRELVGFHKGGMEVTIEENTNNKNTSEVYHTRERRW